MNVTPEEFTSFYQSLPDSALLEIDATELVKVAQECHAAEVARRGLTPAAQDEGPAEVSAAGTEPPAPEADLVCVTEYDHHDEADLARGLLEAAGIPASLETEPDITRLMVPASLAEQALGLLVTPLSDEELEAQAEAAGVAEEEADEEDGQP